MTPYLSIVMCGNNARHTGDFVLRLQKCLDSIFHGAWKFQLDAELIFVEWDPPANRASLAKTIDWSRVSIPTRLITVPPSLVTTIPNPRNVRFFEPWAKNVGIRRADGQFILVINADTVYPDEIMEFLSRKELDPACFYRINRHDVTYDHVERVPYEAKIPFRNRQTGVVEEVTRVMFKETHVVGGQLSYIQRANGGFLPGEKWEGESRNGIPYSPDMLHFNAAGEFIMMTRDKWMEIQGWPETDYWGSVDGQVVWLAHTHGLKQVVFPYPVYHTDHPRIQGSDKSHPPWHDSKPWADKNTKADWGFSTREFSTIQFPVRLKR